ncbi:MAG: hypothetical protein WCC87_19345 [Candidatus Korobacteraceae bacterium]
MKEGFAADLLETGTIVGGAVIPELQGLLADRIGLHHAFVLPVICYLYILFFAVKGLPRKRQV